MKQQTCGLVAAYRRRAFCAKAVFALTAAGMIGVPIMSHAQNAPVPPPNAIAPPNAPVPPPGKAPGKGGVLPPGGNVKVKKVDPRNMRVIKPNDLPGAPARSRAAFGHSDAPLSGTPFSFDFHGTDIDNVLKFFSQMSGMTIDKDKDLTGPVTIINPKPVTLDEAFKILQSVLMSRGFAAVQQDNVVSILPFDRAIGTSTIFNPDTDESPSKLNPRNQVMTQVIPVENTDATALAKDLQPLVNKGASLIGSAGTNSLILTDTASNVQRFIEIVKSLDQTTNNSEMKIYQLKRAEATSIADIINNLYKQITPRSTPNAQPGGRPGQPNFQPPGIPGQPGADAGAAGRPAVIAVPDERTNSVLVVASVDTQERIATTIIGPLDDDTMNAMQTKTRKIKYADAVQVATLVNGILSNEHGPSSASSSSSNSSFQQRAFGGFGGFFNRFGGGNNNNQPGTVTPSTDPYGKLDADQRTNSVLITASAERMIEIDNLISQLDVFVPAETTTFVIPLKNAQATDVAQALGQAFQTSNSNSGGGGFFGFGGGGGGSSTTNFGNTFNNSSSLFGKYNRNGAGGAGGGTGIGLGGRAARLRGLPPGPPNAPDGGYVGDGGAGAGGGSAVPGGVPGVMTADGTFVPTDTGDPAITRQFGFFRGFGGGGSSLGQSSSPQYGRGVTGTYSNLLQLQNNVFVTPSPNGDSIIVTTTPDNYNAVMQLVKALDVVQRQVMIEVIVAEVTLDQDSKLGFTLGGKFQSLFSHSNTAQGQINVPATGFGTTFDPTVAGAQFTINGASYNALLQALATDSKIKVLATPRVFAANGQEAEVQITTSIPYINGQASSGLVSTTVANTVTYLPVGYILDVIPSISRQGLVSIQVHQEASNLLQFLTLGTGTAAITAPETNDRVADTTVTVMDGQTIAVGGLIHDSTTLNVTKIPILSNIPLIGQFFRSKETIRNKQELMIFMTPHVVSSVEEMRELAKKESLPVGTQIPDLWKQHPDLAPPIVVKPPQPKQTNPGNNGTGATETDTDSKIPGTTPTPANPNP